MTILVGNGPSVLSAKLGHVIDSAERVVRFNCYVLRPDILDYTGSKTDVWAVNAGRYDRQSWVPDPRPPLTLVAVPWWNHTQGNLWQRLSEKIVSGAEIIDKHTAKRMTDMFTGDKWPSTGLLTLAHYVEIDTVAVVGFDSFRGPIHHYGDSRPFCGNHDPDIEFQFLESVIRERGVKRLGLP